MNARFYSLQLYLLASFCQTNPKLTPVQNLSFNLASITSLSSNCI